MDENEVMDEYEVMYTIGASLGVVLCFIGAYGVIWWSPTTIQQIFWAIVGVGGINFSGLSVVAREIRRSNRN